MIDIKDVLHQLEYRVAVERIGAIDSETQHGAMIALAKESALREAIDILKRAQPLPSAEMQISKVTGEHEIIVKN